MSVCVCVGVCAWTCVSLAVFVCAFARACMHGCTRVHAFMRSRSCVHANIFSYTHTHVCECVWACMCFICARGCAFARVWMVSLVCVRLHSCAFVCFGVRAFERVCICLRVCACFGARLRAFLWEYMGLQVCVRVLVVGPCVCGCVSTCVHFSADAQQWQPGYATMLDHRWFDKN